MKFAERVTQARRLAILELLAQLPAYEAGQSLIYQALPDHGLAASSDLIAADLAWLGEQGLVDRSEAGGIAIARITQRGLDAADGRAIVPGVQRPGP